jgi:RHS repeat-associated protein
VDTTSITYLHTDHLATPRKATDEAGAVVWQWDSEAFGNKLPESSGATVNLRFPGQYYDQETGLYYNYFRYYDPATGRYITSDPIGLQGGLNTYGYVGGNPVYWVDPWGLKSWICTRPLGGKPGKKGGIFFNHTYGCATDANGNIVCNSTTAGGSGVGSFFWSDGQSTSSDDDYYDSFSCYQMDDDKDDCVEQCLLKKWDEPRPRYGVGPQGTDCQEYTHDAFGECMRRCYKQR